MKKPLPPALHALMSAWGRLGHQARMEQISPERRSEYARRAVNARWARYREAQRKKQPA